MTTISTACLFLLMIWGCCFLVEKLNKGIKYLILKIKNKNAR